MCIIKTYPRQPYSLLSSPPTPLYAGEGRMNPKDLHLNKKFR